MIGHARLKDGLYYLDTTCKNRPHGLVSHTNSSDIILLWHNRLGHPPFFVLKKLFPELFKYVNPSIFYCESCVLAKHHRISFPIKEPQILSPFSLIHSDVWGPSRVANISGSRWFVTFIDDYTRLTWVYLMKSKSEVASIFPSFHKFIQNQFGTKIQTFRSDNGKEYFNQELDTYFEKEGILHHSSCTNTPQQNGVAERKNRHLLEVARALLFQMKVPKTYWGEAVLTASYLINRMPSRVLQTQSPIQRLKALFPNFQGIGSLAPKVFGCSVYVHDQSPTRGKLDPRAIKCVFLGYSSTKKGYKCYHPSTKKIYVSMDVTFVES